MEGLISERRCFGADVFRNGSVRNCVGFSCQPDDFDIQNTEIGKAGTLCFYGMMVAEGVVAMIWAAAAMGLYNKGIAPEHVGKPAVVGLVAKDLLGVLAGTIAIFGMIILPITSGDTALRAMRLIIAENLNIDQRPKKNRLAITLVMLAGVAFLLYFAKLNGDDFIKLWRYFAWSNQTIAVFTFTIAALYLIEQRKTFLLVLIPGTFYFFVVTSYILHQDIGFGLSDTFSYMLAGCLSALYAAWIIGKTERPGIIYFRHKNGAKDEIRTHDIRNHNPTL